MLALLIAMLTLGAALPALAQDGRAIYDRGAGLVARLGSADGPVLPASRLTCAGCHGIDARGGAEGGSLPAPPIGWQVLTQATPERPPYDAAALARLLRQGVTPAGRVISTRMPRFEAAPEHVEALVTHLQALDIEDRQGLGADSIAVTLPRTAGARRAALDAVAAFNREGGAFGRQIIEGHPAFLDLDRLASDLVPRLRAAEEARLQALLRDDPLLRPVAEAATATHVAGTLDQIGPLLPGLLARDAAIVTVGPDRAAMSWAIHDRQDAEAAHIHAVIRATLALLRDQGRQPGRTAMARAIGALDMEGLVEVYHQPPPTATPDGSQASGR